MCQELLPTQWLESGFLRLGKCQPVHVPIEQYDQHAPWIRGASDPGREMLFVSLAKIDSLAKILCMTFPQGSCLDPYPGNFAGFSIPSLPTLAPPPPS